MVSCPSGPSPSPSCRFQLPGELYDSIIDAMDRALLPNAALVARAWYPRSMHNLYSVIELKSRTGFDLLVAQLRASSRVKAWLATARHIIIRGADREPLSLARTRKQYLGAFPLVFAAALPSLRQLEFHQESLSLVHPTFYLCLAQFRDITSLHLTRVEGCSIFPFQRVVCAFPQLKTLSVCDLKIKCLGNASLKPHRHRTNAQLQHLHLMFLSLGTLRAIASCLAHSALCSSLQSVHVDFYAPSERDNFVAVENPVNEVLRASGSSLTTFQETDDRSLRHGEIYA